MKQFTVAILGAPNVGKSTLFNRIIGKRKILEAAISGTTRDRHAGSLQLDDVIMNIVDSGGWNPYNSDAISVFAQKQTTRALQEADVILLLFDGKSGITPLDKELAMQIRKSKKPFVCAVNKIDAEHMEPLLYEFYQLGIADIIPISALHNRQIDDLIDQLKNICPAEKKTEVPETKRPIRICFAGRPNTGKSTLINALCGDERVIVTELPGTTRDATTIRIKSDNVFYDIVDTPGLRRKKKPRTPVEGLMHMSSQKAIQSSDVIGLLLDASEGITAGDIRIARSITEANKACIVLLNKWDLVDNPEFSRKKLVEYLSFKLPFLTWAPVLSISAKTGRRTNNILPLAEKIYSHFSQTLDEKVLSYFVKNLPSTHRLVWKQKKITIKNVLQIKTGPPLILLEINRSEMLHFSHVRFLENALRERFSLLGTPIIITAKKYSKKKRSTA